MCYNGYELNEENGKIMCKKQEEADDDGLSTGAIIGIVFGCIIFLAIIAIIIICILKRRNKEKEREMTKIDEEETKKKEVETIPQNGKDDQEDKINVIEYNKNNEIVDSNANIKPKKGIHNYK